MPALITRCPACATMFKVVPDQLRVSEGWVRCGHCGEVFDAAGHMQAPARAAPADVAPSDPAGHQGAPLLSRLDEVPAPVRAAPAVAAPAEPEDSQSPSSAFPSSLQTEIDEELLSEDPDLARLEAEARALHEDPLDQPFALRREDLSAPGELAPASLPPFPLDEPTFLRQARRDAHWQRPAVRVVLALAAIGLTVLLGLQAAVHERDRLAAAQPGLRPWLARLCEPLGCRIAPPRQIEAIAIDSSAFNRLRPDAYRLQVTLRNQARIDVAMPAIELTLTDSGEQPVVRRVLLPADLGAVRPALAAGAEWSGTAALGLADNSLAGRVAGYRVLAFYP